MGKVFTASSGGFVVQRAHENCDVDKTDQSETKRIGQNVEDDGLVSGIGEERVQVHVRGHVRLSFGVLRRASTSVHVQVRDVERR